MQLYLKTLFLFFGISLSIGAMGQCDQELVDICAKSTDVKYIKHFKIRFSASPDVKKRSEGLFTIMLSKGNHYRFMVCNDESKQGSTIMELSNDFAQYGSNYNAQNDSEYKAFDFLCTKTGPYYIKLFFKDGKEGCGVCVLTLVTD